MSFLLIFNLLLFIAPWAYAYLATPQGAEVMGKNGAGGVLFIYLFLAPILLIFQAILVLLKIAHSRSK